MPSIRYSFAVKDAIELGWDTVPGTMACQVQVTAPDSSAFVRLLFGTEPTQFSAPTELAKVGVYRWKVRCACSTSPLQATMLSQTDSIVVPASFDCGSVTDIDGHTYTGVRIGSQCWMQQNLRTKRYANGDSLLDGSGVGDMSSDPTKRYYFHYLDDPAYTDTFGLLYTWAAVMGSDAGSSAIPSGVQGICPNGWHVPSVGEWDQLADFLGGQAIAGGPMKDTVLWKSPNLAATNSTGFSGLPAGDRTDVGEFVNVRENGDFWTSTDDGSPTNAWIRCLFYERISLSRAFFATGKKPAGFSCRCVKDEP